MADERFGWLKSSLNKGVTSINVKTTSMLEKAKIKTHIGTLSAEIGESQQRIGEKAYALWKKDALQTGLLLEELRRIDEKYEEIARLQQRMNEIDELSRQILGSSDGLTESAKSEYKCANCQAEYGASVKFCARCGFRIQ